MHSSVHPKMSKTNKKNAINVKMVDVSSLLISAVSEGNLVSVKELVHVHGLSYCECDSRGYVLLFVAIKLGHIKIAKFLLQEGAKADCKADNVSTPLHLATKQGFAGLVQLLLDKNVPVDAQNDQNETPLHLAAKGGYAEIVEILLTNNASLTAQTIEGFTPLFFAVEGRHEKVVKMLLKHACTKLEPFAETKDSTLLNHILLCNPSMRDKVNELVVCIVTQDNGRCKTVDELIDLGFILSCEYVNEALLLAAVKKNCVKLIDSILRSGANPNSAKHNPLLLHTAVKNGQKEIAELFLKAGFNANAKNEEGKTCLSYSLNCTEEDKSVEVIHLLLASGANIKEAHQLLHSAVTKGLIEVCKVLIENGADINALNSRNETPLYLATSISVVSSALKLKLERRKQITETTRDEITKLLLKNGADVNVKTRDGYTAFHQAVISGRKESVCIFLQFGVDVDLCTEDGLTPLYLASQEGHTEIVEILCQNNADVDGCHGKVMTPLRLAVLNRKMQVVEILLKFGADIGFFIRDFDDIDDNDEFYYNLIMTLKRHLIKLKAARLYVGDSNSHLDYDAFSGFQRKCEEEVNRMKKEELNPEFTLYNILVNGKNPLYAKNKPLMQILNAFNFVKFPIYENLITSNLRKSKFRLELLGSGQEWLGILMKISSKLNGKKYLDLPIDVLEQIVLYLMNSEIKNLISCGETLKRQLSRRMA